MYEEDIHFIKDNRQSLCNEGTFVGIGSTRKVFRYKEYVIKEHLHTIGFNQSNNEYFIFTELKKRNLDEYLAEIFYVDEQIAIQRYYPNLSLINSQSYELEIGKDSRFSNKLIEAIKIIDKEYDGFDFKDSGNYGLNEDGYLVLIDYGMSKTLYENEWVTSAEKGILPQIYYEKCTSCGEEKELRIYGDNDFDKRCFPCGKQ